MELAIKRKRKARLWRAVFRLYASHYVIDGFKCFAFIMIRSILPLVLAQLLIQFQKPIITDPNHNVTALNFTDAKEPVQLSDPFIIRNSRSVPSHDDLLHDQSLNGKLNKN